MNVRGCTTGEMWIALFGLDPPHSSTGGRTGAYCLLGIQYSVFSMQYSVFSIHSGTYSVFTVFESSNGFPIAVVTGIHMFCMHVVWIDHEYSVGVDYHLELVYIWSRYSFKNL